MTMLKREHGARGQRLTLSAGQAGHGEHAALAGMPRAIARLTPAILGTVDTRFSARSQQA